MKLNVYFTRNVLNDNKHRREQEYLMPKLATSVALLIEQKL